MARGKSTSWANYAKKHKNDTKKTTNFIMGVLFAPLDAAVATNKAYKKAKKNANKKK